MHKEKEEDKIVRLERTLNMVSFNLFAGTNVGLRENNEDCMSGPYERRVDCACR